VDEKHLMHFFQSANTVFKFFRCGVDGALLVPEEQEFTLTTQVNRLNNLKSSKNSLLIFHTSTFDRSFGGLS